GKGKIRQASRRVSRHARVRAPCPYRQHASQPDCRCILCGSWSISKETAYAQANCLVRVWSDSDVLWLRPVEGGAGFGDRDDGQVRAEPGPAWFLSAGTRRQPMEMDLAGLCGFARPPAHGEGNVCRTPRQRASGTPG